MHGLSLLLQGQASRLPPAIFVFGSLEGVLGIMRFDMFASLPEELVIEVVGRLSARDLASAVSSCRALHALQSQAWRAACHRRWPEWAAIAAEPGAQWRRQYELLSLREAEAACLPSVAAVRKVQQNVTERHRSILTEWLCEVRGGQGEGPAARAAMIPCQRLSHAPRRSPSIGSSSPLSFLKLWHIWTTT